SPRRLVKLYIKKGGRRKTRRPRRRIEGLDISGLADKWDGLLGGREVERNPGYLKASLDTAAGQWQSRLAEAESTRSLDELHEFRIATKKLRYRLELVQELERDVPQPMLATLKSLQRVLGEWHCRESTGPRMHGTP